MTAIHLPEQLVPLPTATPSLLLKKSLRKGRGKHAESTQAREDARK